MSQCKNKVITGIVENCCFVGNVLMWEHLKTMLSLKIYLNIQILRGTSFNANKIYVNIINANAKF